MLKLLLSTNQIFRQEKARKTLRSFIIRCGIYEYLFACMCALICLCVLSRCTWVYVCARVCAFLSLSLSLSFYLSIHLSLSLSLSIYLSLCVCVFVHVCVSGMYKYLCMCVHVHVCVRIYVQVCVSE